MVDVCAAAAADDGDGAAFGQSRDDIAHGFGNNRLVGPIGDRRQGAVEVEEDGEALSVDARRQFFVMGERRWQVAHGA